MIGRVRAAVVHRAREAVASAVASAPRADERIGAEVDALCPPPRGKRALARKMTSEVGMTHEKRDSGLFDMHLLNEDGVEQAIRIQLEFEGFLVNLEKICGADGREMAIVRTKLQEAAFFAYHAMAMRPENQQRARGPRGPREF